MILKLFIFIYQILEKIKLFKSFRSLLNNLTRCESEIVSYRLQHELHAISAINKANV